MPVYDYVCKKCGHEFETIERVSEHEKAPHECPECGSKKVERVFAEVFVKTGKKS